MNSIILDYGAGNLNSVYKFFKIFDNLNIEINNNLNRLKSTDLLIIPGVGSFGFGCSNLKKIIEYPNQIEEFTKKGGLLLGICLGAQLFLERSEESLGAEGLGVVNGGSFYLGSNKNYKEKIPRVGWDNILWPSENETLKKRFCYFVQSYEMKPKNVEKVICTEDNIVAAYKKENIWGLQFHPEKSNICGYDVINSIFSTYVKEN